MRKMSTYARKKKFKAQAPADLWITKIQDNRPYSAESKFGERPSIELANNAVAMARAAYQRIDNRVSPPDSQQDFEMLSHVLVVAQIRTYDIGGPMAGEVLERLNAVVPVLDRLGDYWREHKQWFISGADSLLLIDAIDIYEQIVFASTPYEMHEAQTTRLDWFKNVYAKGR